MTGIIRRCPDCGQDRAFEQHHAGTGGCPDTGDWYCPEWHCLTCGACLVLGDVPVMLRPARPARVRDRVA
jgi:hypothetical protein